MTEKLKIKPGKKHKFNIEINLSDRQLEILDIDSGGDGSLARFMLELASPYGPVTVNPSFDCGLGADINDILSLGFMVLAKERGYPLEFEDLFLHPFRIKATQIEELKIKDIDCEIVSEYIPMTVALDANTGKLVTLEEDTGKVIPVEDKSPDNDDPEVPF